MILQFSSFIFFHILYACLHVIDFFSCNRLLFASFHCHAQEQNFKCQHAIAWVTHDSNAYMYMHVQLRIAYRIGRADTEAWWRRLDLHVIDFLWLGNHMHCDVSQKTRASAIETHMMNAYMYMYMHVQLRIAYRIGRAATEAWWRRLDLHVIDFLSLGNHALWCFPEN